MPGPQLPAAPAAKIVAPRKISLPLAGLSGFGALVLMFAVPDAMAWKQEPLTWAWLLCATFLLVFCIATGLGINGCYNGLIIDNRNRVSLSKFQATAWTVLILSAFITAILARVMNGIDNAADIGIPGNLLAVMGISATSLVATPVILNVKSGQYAGDGQADATSNKLADGGQNSVGLVYARPNVAQASWLDMFRGEEVNNAASPDLGKIQQFLITIGVLITYGATLWHMFGGPVPPQAPSTWLNNLPEFSRDTAWLVGISHAGYLAYKAAPHGGTQDAPTPAPQADDAVG